MQALHQRMAAAIAGEKGSGYFHGLVPSSIVGNLRQQLIPRAYQLEAFGRTIHYWDEMRPRDEPTQLLYHMATGSGKTLVMAGSILFLHSRGYRNFLFFVNSTNILEKTRANFLDHASSKYLFADQLMADGKPIHLREVQNFDASGPDDINIIFTTIQGLHAQLNSPAEDRLTFEDLQEKKIVLISDEAHHINVSTKRTSRTAQVEKEQPVSWENTVARIVQANKENVLLEFTATADLSVPEIADKYRERIIFDHPLKEFRRAGHSKEVRVMQTKLPPLERALQAAILSQYRRKLFEEHGKRIKPVILFKSRTIKESRIFQEKFNAYISSLSGAALQRIEKQQDPILQKAFSYLKEKGISLENFALELQDDLSAERTISVNSKDESEQKQLALNSLEDEDNAYRAIFAVDKLNEGWDVLNLFDIVRLYDTHDATGGRPSRTTVTEAQLIGRGARYCPFRISPDQPLFSRKYDDRPEHELRICEELYYHCSHHPEYIKELDLALVEIGIKASPDEEEQQKDRRTNGRLGSSTAGYDRKDPSTWSRKIIHVDRSGPLSRKYVLPIGKMDRHIIRKAMDLHPSFHFARLRTYLPALRSKRELITSKEYLGGMEIHYSGWPALQDLARAELLEITTRALEQLAPHPPSIY